MAAKLRPRQVKQIDLEVVEPGKIKIPEKYNNIKEQTMLKVLMFLFENYGDRLPNSRDFLINLRIALS